MPEKKNINIWTNLAMTEKIILGQLNKTKNILVQDEEKVEDDP